MRHKGPHGISFPQKLIELGKRVNITIACFDLYVSKTLFVRKQASVCFCVSTERFFRPSIESKNIYFIQNLILKHQGVHKFFTEAYTYNNTKIFFLQSFTHTKTCFKIHPLCFLKLHYYSNTPAPTS